MHRPRCPRCNVDGVPYESISIPLPLGQAWEGMVYTCQNPPCTVVFIVGDEVEPTTEPVSEA